ncbi:MAG: iron-containing alcohol dehydrogenase, partial [Candidatus Hodarchaeota archaeon]
MTYYLKRPVIIGSGTAQKWLEHLDEFTLVTSKSPARYFKSIIDEKNPTIFMDPSIEVIDLASMVPKVKTKWVVGIGGGRVNDAAKYLAKRARKKLCLIPSILSTTSWLNIAIAVRKDRKLFFPSTKQPNKIIIDADLISSAPPVLNLGGLADLLCCASAIGDWIISHLTNGEKISKRGVKEFEIYI